MSHSVGDFRPLSWGAAYLVSIKVGSPWWDCLDDMGGKLLHDNDVFSLEGCAGP